MGIVSSNSFSPIPIPILRIPGAYDYEDEDSSSENDGQCDEPTNGLGQDTVRSDSQRGEFGQKDMAVGGGLDAPGRKSSDEGEVKPVPPPGEDVAEGDSQPSTQVTNSMTEKVPTNEGLEQKGEPQLMNDETQKSPPAKQVQFAETFGEESETSSTYAALLDAVHTVPPPLKNTSVPTSKPHNPPSPPKTFHRPSSMKHSNVGAEGKGSGPSSRSTSPDPKTRVSILQSQEAPSVGGNGDTTTAAGSVAPIATSGLCVICGTETARRCMRCKAVFYCTRLHQKQVRYVFHKTIGHLRASFLRIGENTEQNVLL